MSSFSLSRKVLLAAVLLLSFLYHRAIACSTTTFSTIYDAYPDCATPCLACPDADYVDNFANNCDYASGDCCSSRYHTVISETWACVSKNCGSGNLAQNAFNIFVKYCKDHNVALAAGDVPTGYKIESNGTGSGNNGSSGTAGKGNGGPLSTTAIIGLVVGIVGTVATVGGTYYGWRVWRNRRPHPTAVVDSSALAMIHNSSDPRPWVNLPSNASVEYTRKTSSFLGYVATEERFRVTTPPPAVVSGGGRVIGEV